MRIPRIPRFLHLALAAALALLAGGCCSSGRLIEHDGVAYWRVRCPRRLFEHPWYVELDVPTNYPGAVYSTIDRNGSYLLRVGGRVAYYDRDFKPFPAAVGNNPLADKDMPHIKTLREYNHRIDPSGTMTLDLISFRFEDRPPGGILHLRYLDEAEQFMDPERNLTLCPVLN